LQFHCGKPPPAAEPRTLITMVLGQMAARQGPRQDEKRGLRTVGEGRQPNRQVGGGIR
jgi:hypothetical protein